MPRIGVVRRAELPGQVVALAAQLRPGRQPLRCRDPATGPCQLAHKLLSNEALRQTYNLLAWSCQEDAVMYTAVETRVDSLGPQAPNCSPRSVA